MCVTDLFIHRALTLPSYLRWITNSYEADVFLVFATVDPSKGYKGITCFVATKDMGIQIAKKEQKLGIRASSTCTLNFDDMEVPAENVIGEVGQGYKVGTFGLEAHWPALNITAFS